MGFLYKTGRVRVYILIFLIIASFVLSVPIKRAFNKSVNNKISEYTKLVYDATGYHITYNSMSPSILSNFYIKEIEVVNDDGIKLFSISKTRVNYKLTKLFKSDLQNGISSVVIDGIDLNVTEAVNLYEKYKDKINTRKIEFSEVKKLIPENIKLKNINFEYENEKLNSSLLVKNITVNNSARKQVISFQMDSYLKAAVYSLNKNASCNLDISGTITEQIENSFINIKLNDLTDGKYKLNKLSLHAVYQDNKIEVHTIQAVNPVSVALDYDIKTNDINIQLKTEKLSPASLITMTSRQKELQKFNSLLIDTNTILKSNINERTLDYISDSHIFVPDDLFAGGFDLNFTVFGNQNKIELTKFNIDGKNCDISAKLSYIFNKMQLSGFVEVPKYTLNNGTVISTEVYFDQKDSGFMAFSPQIFVGERAFTALQFDFMPRSDSYDFIFDMYDYAHIENTDPGNFRVEGSYLNGSKYLQSNISLNSIYLDSIAALAAQFLEKELSEKVIGFQNTVSPFMLSGDIYASTDLKSISYNVPYVLLANTKKDNQVMMFSLNGTEQNIQINQFSLIYNKYVMEATASLDKNIDTSDLFFTVDLNSDSIPYHFSGTVMPEVCNITGDYGTNIEIHYDESKKIDGHLMLNSIPLSLPGNSIIVSADADIKYTKRDGPSIQINLFEAEGADGNLTVNPRIAFAGNITKYGAQINSITYTDLYSALEGTADVMLNINENVFDSMNCVLNVKNPITDESINMDCNISNPEHLALTKENIMKYIYLNFQIQTNDFSLNRIAIQKNENNVITASINASGTLEHPYLTVTVEEMSMIFATKFLHLRGNVIVEDKDLTLNDIDMSYSFLTVNDINATASLDTMNLDATGDLKFELLGNTITAPLVLNASNAIIPDGKMLPDSLTVKLSTDCVSGSLIRKEFPMSISALYSDNKVSIFSDSNIGINGFYQTDGLLQFTIDNGYSIFMNIDGIANPKFANIEIYDVNADMQKVFEYINFDELFQVKKGNLNGEVVISGSFSDPDLNGYFLLSGLETVIPKLTPQKLTSTDVELAIVNSEIDVNNANLSLKSGETLETNFKIFMNKWALDHVEGNMKTAKKHMFPAKLNVSTFKIDGDLSVDLQLYYEEPVMEISGNVFGENTTISTSLSNVSSIGLNDINKDEEIIENSIKYCTDLNISLGTHSVVTFDPVLRCVFVPNTKIRFLIDQNNDSYSIDGALNLKSGDIAYLNRNFYIKSGTIKFNQEDILNPLVTLTAETREKDDRGQTVKITMSVEKQYLLSLTPKFTANPSKSENDIRMMLGQIAVADSNNAANFLVAASDYAIQSMVMRQAENKLRDLCNFDIFSVRTNVLQNTINMGFSGDLSKENISIGNFLDNTTVYIGKYLGSSLYLDAMLHVTLENGKSNDITSTSGVTFHPEFGMELESPFANIRVNMAPDINALLNNQFVPSTSVTLSWKYTF